MVDHGVAKVVPRALVMNCHYNGLSLIQALGRKGVPVIALDSKRGIGTRSRYAEYFKVPDPAQDREGFLKALIKLGSTFEAKPIVFPTNDHWAEALSWGEEELEQYYHLCVAKIDTVELLLDKEKFGRWAVDNGVPVPRVWSSSEALEDVKNLPYPIAVKANTRRRSGQNPESSVQMRNADRLRFVTCNNKEALAERLADARSVDVPVFCQQVINGRSDAMRTIGIYANKGKLLGLVYGKKVKGFPAQYGDCIVGQAEPVPAWARDLAVKCSSLLGYTGIAELEVMIDTVTGDKYLIEINPRSWSWIGVGPAAGVDLAWIAYQDMVNEIQPKQCIESCLDGKPAYYAKILADFQNTVLWYRFSSAPEWAQNPFVWWKSFSRKKGVFAEFARDDLAVSLFSLIASFRQFLSAAYKVLRGSRFD